MMLVNEVKSLFDRRAGKLAHDIAVVLFLFLGLIVCLRVVPVNSPVIEVQLHAAEPGIAQWFLDSGDGYSEKESVSARLQKGNNRIEFRLPPGVYRAMRFDPLNAPGEVTISSISLLSGDEASSAQVDIGNIRAHSAIAELETTSEGLRVVPESGNADPQLILETGPALVVAPLRDAHTVARAVWLLVLSVTAWFLLRAVLERLDVGRVVVLGLAIATVLIMAMSAVNQSAGSVHPDERLHLSGFDYYRNHLLPPAADSPDIVDSLRSSPWGVSYLNNHDVVYLVAARFVSPFRGMVESPAMLARTFQNMLWLMLLIFAICRKTWAIALAALLVSPQVWYVFSYFNGDAFSLFLCSVAVMLVCDPQGGLRRFMEGKGIAPGAVAFSLCIGLILVSKANYIPVAMALFLWIAICHMDARWVEIVSALLMAAFGIAASSMGTWGGVDMVASARWLSGAAVLAGLMGAGSIAWRYWRQNNVRPVFHRAIFLVGVAMLVAMPRVANDLWINGGPAEKAEAIASMQEQHARNDFKPSVVASGAGYPGLHPAQKGVSLREMLFSRPWPSISAKSAFGTYGYMNIWAPPPVYWSLWLGTFLLAAGAAVALVGRCGRHGVKLLSLALGTSVLVLGSSIMFSWLYSYQPQGRYLLPVVPIFALLLATAAPHMPARFIKLMLLALGAISAWSYIYVGLPEIASSVG